MAETIRDPQQLSALMNHNVGLEHGAIYQYLAHAYVIGEGQIGTEIINIARSEMRHLKYFAGLVVELGGIVALERPNVTVRAASLAEMLRLGSLAEEDAIADYSRQLDLIDHPGCQRVLERVIMDEQLHREQWGGFEAEVSRLATQASYPTPTAPKDPALVRLLNEAFETEYNQLLVYLRHYFQVQDWEAKDFLFENALWRMKHMSYLGDELHEEGADPSFAWHPQPVEGAMAERLAQARELEATSQQLYQRLASCPVPPFVRSIFLNAMGHGRYQEGQIKLLQEITACPGQAAPTHPTPFPEPAADNPPTPHGVSFTPSEPSSGRSLTVGSLLDPPAP